MSVRKAGIVAIKRATNLQLLSQARDGDETCVFVCECADLECEKRFSAPASKFALVTAEGTCFCVSTAHVGAARADRAEAAGYVVVEERPELVERAASMVSLVDELMRRAHKASRTPSQLQRPSRSASVQPTRPASARDLSHRN